MTIWLAAAFAHQPFFPDDYGTPEDSFVVEDEDLSIVLHHNMTCERPEVWLSYEVDAGYELYVQLGLPQLERFEDWRPSVAVVAPGLPDVDVPFDAPEGMGAIVFDTADVAEPDPFFEPFTQTESWVLVETYVTLPESGPAYVVAWDPGHMTGKLWVATGTVEDFSNVSPMEFGSWDKKVNDWFETGKYSEVEPVEEVVCETPEPTEPTDGTNDAPSLTTESEDEASSGCTMTGARRWHPTSWLERRRTR